MDVGAPLPGLFVHMVTSGVLSAPPTSPVSLSVLYGALAISFGTQVEPPDVSKAPRVMLPAAAAPAGSVFALALVDPDAPSPKTPTERSRLLWLVADARAASDAGSASASSERAGEHALSLDAASGAQVLQPYAAPNPQLGNHRYVFVLLRQRRLLGAAAAAAAAPALRASFSLPAFAASIGAEAVGANFFCSHAKESWGSSGGSGKKRKRG